MSFPDPITLLNSAGTPLVVLPELGSTIPNTSVYRKRLDATNQFEIAVRQTETKARKRSEFRVTWFKTPALPSDAAIAPASAYVVLDRPQIGFSDAQLHDIVIDLCKTVESGDYLDRLINGER